MTRFEAIGAMAALAAQTRKETMTLSAHGEFEVKIVPQPQDDSGQNVKLGRLTLDKVFHGELDGTAKGQMLTGMTDTKGSAGYVAIEHVIGTLHGRAGAFTLQHSGTADRNVQNLVITVVPDSGTGKLTGLSGRMDIKVEGGKHFYDFHYSIAETD